MAWRLPLCSSRSGCCYRLHSSLRQSPLLHPVPQTSRSHPGQRSPAARWGAGHWNVEPNSACGRSNQVLPSGVTPCRAKKATGAAEEQRGPPGGDGSALKRGQQAVLWAAEAVYVLWLFLLPYAPGDPVWAISSATINDLVGLSLNFFFILPLLNAVGIHVIEAPVLHPVAEGLFNFVIAWTLLFAPLLFTDYRRDRYKGSLDLLWGFQMFLTNTFLIPYMAIRLNEVDEENSYGKPSRLSSLMINGASIVGITGGLVCLISAIWTFYGRSDGGFGSIADRIEFFGSYIGSERLAYAFIWDICLYAVFQPWLIGDNLGNVKRSSAVFVSTLRFIPVVGLVAYLLTLKDDKSIEEM